MYLHEEELRQLEDSAMNQHFAAGGIVLDEGSAANHLYFIRQGLVEVFYHNGDTRITVALLGRGEFFGEMGFFDGNPRVRNIQAIEDSDVFVWDHTAMQVLAENNASLYGRLVSFLLVRVSERFRKVLDDLDPLTGYGAAVSRGDRLTGIAEPLPHDWLARPEFLSIKKISEKFKADIFSLSYKLQEGKTSEDDLIALCAAVLNSLYEDVLCYGQEFPREPEGMWGYLFKEIFPYFMRSRFAERIYFKPRGYAGDHMMMEMIYADVPSGDGKLGELVDAWCLQSFGARATRGRRRLLCQWLHEKSVFLLKKKPFIHIMNMACGPGRELADFLDGCSFSEKINVLCVDIDEDALARSDSNLSTIQHRATIRFFKENLIKWALGKVNQQIGYQDIIYSAGLADYLEDRLFIALVDRAYEHLNKGGVLIIGNFSPNPDQFFMDHILHWRLIYRTADQLRSLFAQTRFGRNVRVVAEDEGVNLFVEAVRA